MEDLYKLAHQKDGNSTEAKASGTWLDIQKLALDDSATSDEKIKVYVLEAQRLSVKLPIIRKATAKVDIKDEDGTKLFSLEEGQTVVCDIVSQIPLFASKLLLWKPASLLQSTCAHRADQATVSRHGG